MAGEQTVYYVQNPQGQRRRVDSYKDFRNGSFEELWRFGHIACRKERRLLDIEKEIEKDMKIK